MSLALPAAPRRVLADAIARPASRAGALAVDAALVAAGAVFVAVFAQITIPLPIVPITGQTLAVLLVGASLGAVRGASALSLYAVLGLVGLPVYADGAHGAAVLFGSTGGFIVGFILAAGIVGWLSERRADRKVLRAFLTFAGGTVVTFLVGLPWLFVWFQLVGADVYTAWGYDSALSGTIESGLLPFIVPGLVKALLAALVIPGAWGVLRLLTRRR